MKGYPGICKDCVYEKKLTVEAPCYGCISNEDLALHKPDSEIEYAYFKAKTEVAKNEQRNIIQRMVST